MAVNFSLAASDYKLLERAVAARFEREHGRLNVAFFAQVFAWMFITLAVFTFVKQWERSPEAGRTYGVMLLFAVLGFLFASARALAGQWLYRRYELASNHAFTEEQSVDLQGGSLVLDSATAKAVVHRAAIIDRSEDERNHYLFITGVQAITIPKTAAAALGAEFSAFLAGRVDEA
jgi:hypothetical protein